MYILLAENQAQTGSAVESLLAMAGHTITRASSPADALAILDQGTFPMVIIHGREKDWGGVEFCHQIKARQMAQYIYTLILAEPGQASYGLVVDDLIPCPFDHRTFLTSLALADRWLDQHGGQFQPGLPFPEFASFCA